MKIKSINHLARFCARAHGSAIDNTTQLSALLASIVRKPVKEIKYLGPNREDIGERDLPNILTGDSRCSILIVRENGCSAKILFPRTVNQIDDKLNKLRDQQNEEERRLSAFSDELLEELDGYGHMNWTIGNGDWTASADAVLGCLDGKYYLATHVVVDSESGCFTDTFDENVFPVEGDAPKGILASHLDSCVENCTDEDDPLDVEQCLETARRFDEHVAKLWKSAQDGTCFDRDIVLDWGEDSEEEPFDPVAMGWVGSDGRP